jgi:hypothetical protein
MYQRSETVSQLSSVGYTERRKTGRIHNAFPATVEGVDVSGKSFKVTTALDNLGRGGLYLRLDRCVEVGSSLSVVFRLSTSAEPETNTARVSLKGKVIRIDEKDGGICGVALKFKPFRFIYPQYPAAGSSSPLS